MDITKDFIKAKQPCSSGLRWFLRHYENGSNYQPLLDALVDAGRADDASWLLTQFGPTSEERIVDDIDTQAVVFAGRLEVRGNIHVDSVMHTGRTIRAQGTIVVGTSINCGGDLVAGGGIRCGGSIETGDDISAQWGVEATGTTSAAAGRWSAATACPLGKAASSGAKSRSAGLSRATRVSAPGARLPGATPSMLVRVSSAVPGSCVKATLKQAGESGHAPALPRMVRSKRGRVCRLEKTFAPVTGMQYSQD